MERKPFDVIGLEHGVKPQQDVTLVIHRANGESEQVAVTLRNRYSRGDRLLPARWNPSLCAQTIARGHYRFFDRKVRY